MELQHSELNVLSVAQLVAPFFLSHTTGVFKTHHRHSAYWVHTKLPTPICTNPVIIFPTFPWRKCYCDQPAFFFNWCGRKPEHPMGNLNGHTVRTCRQNCTKAAPEVRLNLGLSTWGSSSTSWYHQRPTRPCSCSLLPVTIRKSGSRYKSLRTVTSP